MPCVPPVEALTVVAFLPVAFPSVEGFPSVVVLPVVVLVSLREVVVLFVEDEA